MASPLPRPNSWRKLISAVPKATQNISTVIGVSLGCGVKPSNEEREEEEERGDGDQAEGELESAAYGVVGVDQLGVGTADQRMCPGGRGGRFGPPTGVDPRAGLDAGDALEPGQFGPVRLQRRLGQGLVDDDMEGRGVVAVGVLPQRRRDLAGLGALGQYAFVGRAEGDAEERARRGQQHREHRQRGERGPRHDGTGQPPLCS
ncbi:hypothetical protein [Streptomyces sp. NPDC018584]|uniref:hypothetical protein n=1 Tax=unclassified Streptomyces TaxID=2593676 RepID=UPI0037B3986F